jgi:hypothetical protein
MRDNKSLKEFTYDKRNLKHMKDFEYNIWANKTKGSYKEDYRYIMKKYSLKEARIRRVSIERNFPGETYQACILTDEDVVWFSWNGKELIDNGGANEEYF